LVVYVFTCFFYNNPATRIVSLPHHRYVLKGHGTTVRCHNITHDKNRYITNAVWYRDYQNGTSIQIGSSGAVCAKGYKLEISPTIKSADEGVYYCCIPNGPCGNGSLASTILLISSKLTILQLLYTASKCK